MFRIKFILIWIWIRGSTSWKRRKRLEKIQIIWFFSVKDIIIKTMFFLCHLWAYYSCELNKKSEFLKKIWYFYNFVHFGLFLIEFITIFFATRIRIWPNEVDPGCFIQKDITEKQQTTENMSRVPYFFFNPNIKSFHYELFGVFLVEKGILYFSISTIQNLLCLIRVEP